MKRSKPLRARGKRYRARIKRGVRLDAAGIAELRKQAFERARGFCENEKCQRWTPWDLGEMDHKVRRGMGGADSLDNVRWLCRRCHRSRHGIVQFSPLWKEIMA